MKNSIASPKMFISHIFCYYFFKQHSRQILCWSPFEHGVFSKNFAKMHHLKPCAKGQFSSKHYANCDKSISVLQLVMFVL